MNTHISFEQIALISRFIASIFLLTDFSKRWNSVKCNINIFSWINLMMPMVVYQCFFTKFIGILLSQITPFDFLLLIR